MSYLQQDQFQAQSHCRSCRLASTWRGIKGNQVRQAETGCNRLTAPCRGIRMNLSEIILIEIIADVISRLVKYQNVTTRQKTLAGCKASVGTGPRNLVGNGRRCCHGALGHRVLSFARRDPDCILPAPAICRCVRECGARATPHFRPDCQGSGCRDGRNPDRQISASRDRGDARTGYRAFHLGP